MREGEIGKNEYAEGGQKNVLEIRTDLQELGRIDEDFEERLKKAGVSEDQIFMLQLGLREAAVNGLVHGNLGIKKPEDAESGEVRWDEMVAEKLKSNPEFAEKMLRVEYLAMEKDMVRISIEDEGEGFDYKELSNNFENGVMKEYGRGFKLISQMYDVEYQGKGNKVVLTWPKKS